MVNRVLMDIMQPGEITPLKRQVRLPVVLPEPLPAGALFTPIELLGGGAVQFLNHDRQGSCRL